MNTSTSECSSGCESGWTTYLDHLSNSTNPYTHYTHQDYQGKGANYVHDHDHDHDQEADEDLSMVSDASSGPPHSHGPPPPQQDRKQQKSKTKEKKNKKLQQHSFCLDDTASSPFLQGSAVPPENQHHSFSTAHVEEERMPKTKMGFFKSSGSLLGRKRQ